MNQGWAVGAVETAEAMLQRAYGLPVPAWMRNA
jgi:hypothetical protein